MGSKSYAEFTLKDNMASSPEVVRSFLNDMSKIVRLKAEEEIKNISNFKRSKGFLFGEDVEPWDEPYFTRMMKSLTNNLDFSVVASYFSLPQCIEGLKVLAKSLFGVKFQEIPLGPGESWHPDVLKLSLHHPNEIFYALIDQTLHTMQPSSIQDTIAVVSDLKKEHTSWRHVEGTHWHTRFSHLVSYGAGYYSYLYAKCFASTIWKKIFEEDPLSEAAGSALRSKFLEHGGAKDPAIILKDLVGNSVIRNLDGGIIPDITSLGEEMKLVN